MEFQINFTFGKHIKHLKKNLKPSHYDEINYTF